MGAVLRPAGRARPRRRPTSRCAGSSPSPSVPGLLSVVAIVFLVKEHREAPQRRAFTTLAAPASPAFRWLLVGSLLFAVGNSSDTFILLRAKDVGHEHVRRSSCSTCSTTSCTRPGRCRSAASATASGSTRWSSPATWCSRRCTRASPPPGPGRTLAVALRGLRPLHRRDRGHQQGPDRARHPHGSAPPRSASTTRRPASPPSPPAPSAACSGPPAARGPRSRYGAAGRPRRRRSHARRPWAVRRARAGEKTARAA